MASKQHPKRSVAEWPHGNRYRRDSEFRERRKAAAREYYRRNREAIETRRAEYKRLRQDPVWAAARVAEREAARRTAKYRKYLRSIKALYGITQEQYEAKRAEQDGCCAICREDRPLSVDHDHLTGDFRGLLCHRCNIHLRVLEEEERWLAAARAYLAP